MTAYIHGTESTEQERLAALNRITNRTFLHRLDFPDASFDLVYARYLLEHVADPETVLREMRRVARPGARVAVCENDIDVMRIDPPCPTFDSVWTAFGTLQASLGGDAYIGRRLFRLFRNAGFDDV